MRWIIFLTLFVTTVFISGCATYNKVGNERVAAIDLTTVKTWKTSKSDLLKQFGPPQAIKKSTEDETQDWIYWSNNETGTSFFLLIFGVTDIKAASKTVTFHLDKNNYVTKYDIEETK